MSSYRKPGGTLHAIVRRAIKSNARPKGQTEFNRMWSLAQSRKYQLRHERQRCASLVREARHLAAERDAATARLDAVLSALEQARNERDQYRAGFHEVESDLIQWRKWLQEATARAEAAEAKLFAIPQDEICAIIAGLDVGDGGQAKRKVLAWRETLIKSEGD